MHRMSERSREWRGNWPLLVAAMIGFSTLGLPSYAFSAFIPHIEQSFGWTRAQTMAGFSLSAFAGIALNVIVGMVVDRFGSRKVGLLGLCVISGAFAGLGTATGTFANWVALWLLVATGSALVQSTVWTRAVTRRFDRSRGSALAIVLSGSAVTTVIAPFLATMLIAAYGWRAAFACIGALWFVVAFPVVFLLFRDRPTEAGSPRKMATPPPDEPGLTLGQGLRTAAFWQLYISFGCFSFYSMTLATNLIPLLSEAARGQEIAVKMASVMGVFGIIARLSVGYLLDRLPGTVIGTVNLLLPVIGCTLLLLPGSGLWGVAMAVSMFGLAIGAEIDVALYLATRHFGLRAFAALFGLIISSGAIPAAIGPLITGWLHDGSGSYTVSLQMIIAVMGIGAVAMATMKPPPR